MKNAPEFPHIEIKYGKLIDPIFIVHAQAKYPDWQVPTQDEVEKKVALFQKEWAESGEGPFKQLCAFLGFRFDRKTMDVYVVSGTPRDISDPTIIRSRYTPEEFVDVLFHELLHRLLVINKSKTDSRFENESRTTRNHINVFALLTYLYQDILNDTQRLARIMQSTRSDDYQRAWEIVEKEGYLTLIDECKKNINPPQ